MIYIQTLDLEWYPGSKMLATQSASIKRAFEEYIAYIFVNEVKKCIDTQRYKYKWPPLSPQYLAFKRKRGLSPVMWEATSQLKSTLKVMDRKTHLVIGWDKRLLHKSRKGAWFYKHKTRLPIYKLAKYMEYGTFKVPPRPLFRLVHQSISKNIRRYWDKFSKLFLTNNNSKYRQIFKINRRRAFKQYIRDSYLKLKGIFQLFKRRDS